MTWNSQRPSCLSLLSASITDMWHYAQHKIIFGTTFLHSFHCYFQDWSLAYKFYTYSQLRHSLKTFFSKLNSREFAYPKGKHWLILHQNASWKPLMWALFRPTGLYESINTTQESQLLNHAWIPCLLEGNFFTITFRKKLKQLNIINTTMKMSY